MLQVLFRCFRIITKITTGAPKTAVTVLMLNSVGAKTVRASQSLNRQNTLPPRKQPGISTSGLVSANSQRIRCGTAIPTKETGPANAATQPDKMLDKITIKKRRCATLTPMLFAYVSPIWYAPIGLDNRPLPLRQKSRPP